MTRSKGQMLLFLKSKKFNVPNLLLINLNSFLINKEFYIRKIQKKFKNQKIAIRSSSLDEDNLKTTNAGKFQSFLNISSSNKSEIISKIITVGNSYKKKNKKNQIIIQNMLTDVKISGVCTTIDIHNYLPTITINYSLGNNTDIVTSGRENSFSISIADKKHLRKKNIFYKLLIEIEKLIKILKTNLLDIEFVIDKQNKLHILQVRNLILPKTKKIVDKSFYFKNLKRLEKKIYKLKNNNQNLYGDQNYYGVMPDWNPAEIIGLKPRPLALSLYQELITDHIWSKHRHIYGFKNVDTHHLMTNFFGTPFIDVRVDFNSWLPSQLSPDIAKKIINYYLNKFKRNRNFHDKVEFEILFTCFTLGTELRIKKELKNILNKKEILEFKNSLKNITKIAFKESNKDLNKIKILEKNLIKFPNLENNNISNIYYLIEECKKNGTIAFAGLARCGFIAVDLLNSLVENEVLTTREKNKFLNSINNIATKVNNDFIKLKKKEFCKINGHLRPNTYDINTFNYEEGYEIYFSKKKNFKVIKSSFSFSNKQKKYINNFLKKHRFELTCNEFIKFLRDSIYLREYAKFIFTKCIDLVFKNLISFGKKYKISRDDLSYLNIGTFLKLHDNLDSISIISNLKQKIKNNKKIYQNNSLIHLPETIISIKDLYLSEKNMFGGNFITQKKISAKIYELNNLKNVNHIENKILLLENADPGYDFIFSKNIKGLITKFGGQNSHMSIRCSELGLPASIGVGEEMFKNLKNKIYITLDCLNKKIY